jgi:hypothetical protein
MRWKFSIFVLALSVLACNLGAPTQTAPQIRPSPTLEPLTSTETPTPNIVPVQPSPVPTNTLIPTQTLVPSNSGSNPVTEENLIRFPAGGTWVTVGTHLEKDTSIDYVLSAMKDQVMSVSIDYGRPFMVEVKNSTTVLTDPDNEHSFWRGTLPADGEYRVTVKTPISADFTLRVVINPPGQAIQYFDYVSPRGTATLRYPDEFAPIAYIPTGLYKGTPDLVLEFVQPEFYRPTTNLGEAYFLFSESTDSQIVATCTQLLPQLEAAAGQKTINGLDFVHSEISDAAAGNIYDQVVYRTVYNNVCYEMVFYMHSANVGNFTPGTVEEYGRARLIQKFEQILNTFTVK